MFITARSKLRKVLFLALSVTFLFVYEISREVGEGTAERICAKFTQKTCLGPCLDEFEGQGQRSKGQGHQGQKRHFSALWQTACGLCFLKHL